MAVSQEDDFWQRKVDLLEKERESLRREVENSWLDVSKQRSELEQIRQELEELEKENEKLELEAEQKGETGNETARLNKELRAGKVGFEQAKFERDSLEAELRALKKSWRLATRRPTPGRIERVGAPTGGSEQSLELGDEPIRLDIAVVVSNKAIPGTFFIYQDRVNFEPDLREAFKEDQVQFEISTKSGNFHMEEKIQELTEDQILFREGVFAPIVVQRPESEPLEFVGFQDAIAAVHARVLSELLNSNPVISSSKRDVSKSQLLKRRGSTTPKTKFLQPPKVPPQSKLQAPSIVAGSADKVAGVPATPSPLSAHATPRRKERSFTPKLSEPSQLLNKDRMVHIYDQVPKRYQGSNLTLLYSTMRDGISLQTFFQRCARRSPTIVLLKDSNGYIFGCFASAPWRVEKSYYGTGECFVFSVVPKFEAFRWTRGNSYFQLSKEGFLALGGGGHFALWVDSEFFHGTSDECQTFGNHCLASSVEFECVALEAWGFF